MRKLGILILLTLIFPGVVQNAGAGHHTDKGWGLGAIVGYTKPSSASLSGAVVFGGDVNFQLNEAFRFKAVLTYSRQSITSVTAVGNFNTDVTSIFYGIGANYHLDQIMLEGLYGGVLLGIATSSSKTTGVTATTSSSDLGLGPVVGYEYFLIDSLSVGAEFDLLVVFGTSTETSINILAPIRYWF